MAPLLRPALPAARPVIPKGERRAGSRSGWGACHGRGASLRRSPRGALIHAGWAPCFSSGAALYKKQDKRGGKSSTRGDNFPAAVNQARVQCLEWSRQARGQEERGGEEKEEMEEEEGEEEDGDEEQKRG
ncbi:unnamed protein product [Prorocentrum cordatum]|uniref:Uncharacterized protein n=1 Tax=Prorocentrum cordatum TaxID=2364126 RepID=A0ABN9SRC7_9DINO|nr:unnamed protein product [Polarella glacialis]